jgi:hypothetical protein
MFHCSLSSSLMALEFYIKDKVMFDVITIVTSINGIFDNQLCSINWHASSLQYIISIIYIY